MSLDVWASWMKILKFPLYFLCNLGDWTSPRDMEKGTTPYCGATDVTGGDVAATSKKPTYDKTQLLLQTTKLTKQHKILSNFRSASTGCKVQIFSPT